MAFSQSLCDLCQIIEQDRLQILRHRRKRSLQVFDQRLHAVLGIVVDPPLVAEFYGKEIVAHSGNLATGA